MYIYVSTYVLSERTEAARANKTTVKSKRQSPLIKEIKGKSTNSNVM